MINRLYLLALLAAFGTGGCGVPNLDAFEKSVDIPGQSWSYSFRPQVSFTVSDTTAAYKVLVVCRHTEAYAYNNLWLLISTQKPGETTRQQDRFELTLQDRDGHWYGSGMDDIWEQRIPLFPGKIHFSKAGTYTVTFEQNMRDNPLTGILDIGLRVEKGT